MFSTNSQWCNPCVLHWSQPQNYSHNSIKIIEPCNGKYTEPDSWLLQELTLNNLSTFVYNYVIFLGGIPTNLIIIKSLNRLLSYKLFKCLWIIGRNNTYKFCSKISIIYIIYIQIRTYVPTVYKYKGGIFYGLYTVYITHNQRDYTSKGPFNLHNEFRLVLEICLKYFLLLMYCTVHVTFFCFI